MKKIICTLLCAALICGVFAACSTNNKPEKAETKNENGKISIVCTVFPIYDWVTNILGEKADNADVTMLLDTGADLHSYQPTANDIIKISECDLFIYVGGESDKWADDALKNATNKDMKVINLMQVLGDKAKEEEVVEGMQAEDEESEESEEETEYDEHVWLSLKNADLFVEEIAEKLGEIDPDNKAAYDDNAKKYRSELTALDGEYQKAVAAAKTKTLLFGDRFPFRYLTDDYGLKYYAAFVGCSAETEASFETITFLANKVDELGLKYVMVIEGGDGKIANTVIDNTKGKNQKVLTLNSMQKATTEDVKKGVTYLGIMRSNLEVLKTALS